MAAVRRTGLAGRAGQIGRAGPPERAGPIGSVHRLILWLVWATFAASGVVFSEPAPVDAGLMGLVLLLPAAGLVLVTPRLASYLALWGVVGAGGLLASTASTTLQTSATFTVVSIYLYLASFTIAAFVAHAPRRHTALILDGWLVAALVAGGAGLIGYFDLLPGAFELFTRFGRASGTFKDPNVLGAFLVAPFLYTLHLMLHAGAGTTQWRVAFAMLAAAGLALAVLLTFSRGAWINLAAGLAIYAALACLTARSARERQRITLALLAGAAVLALVTLGVLQDDRIATVMADRATLTQSYDVGPAGRFGGQHKAFDIAISSPLGIGAGQFVEHHHYEDVHNVYLSVFLNNGWLGGFAYAALVILTLGLGAIALHGADHSRPFLLIALAAFAATALEGAVIDTDHWRSFYLLMALVWGLSANASPDEEVPS